MLLTDYFRSQRDATWDFAIQSGVRHGVIRLPEDGKFDYLDAGHWETLVSRFTDFGITPVAIEPMPNELHDPIKKGSPDRDAALEKVVGMFPLMARHGIRTICFNFMACVGWHRTRADYPERGGALVTAFDLKDYKPTREHISAEQLWENYRYFLDAVLPAAEKHGIFLALHPDDPPLPKLGEVERIMISRENIRRALFDVHPSPSLGLCMCQANFFIMGEDLMDTIREFAPKIGMVHFRNTTGHREEFRETFHDNGRIDMAKVMACYHECGVDVPIRVDHVPTMAGEKSSFAGYDAMGRLFAIGYLKGIMDAVEGKR